ncbi:hypothetical protein [uncultured Tateyamaria sp.]|uniref:hypothetical protein n=1 Tax=uncultured Tateyamaria sp. TaxID=455651 RepID=UPI0026133BA5|nr:hypothetical protein [uncultured Tateyamaria sp.]
MCRLRSAARILFTAALRSVVADKVASERASLTFASRRVAGVWVMDHVVVTRAGVTAQNAAKATGPIGPKSLWTGHKVAARRSAGQ